MSAIAVRSILSSKAYLCPRMTIKHLGNQTASTRIGNHHCLQEAILLPSRGKKFAHDQIIMMSNRRFFSTGSNPTSMAEEATTTAGVRATNKPISQVVKQIKMRSAAKAKRFQIQKKVPEQKKPIPPKQQEKKIDEAFIASDRTHSHNTRLNLSRNSLVLRFSNENSYLNWARNGVLSSGVGVAMYAQEHHRGAQLSGAGLLLLGFGYIGVGTAKYIYYILRFRQVMELGWGSVIGTISHASIALMIWLTATASFLESVPLELDAMLLTEPIASYLPFRIRQGLIETYSLYLDDLEHHNDEQERVLRAIRGEKDDPEKEEANIEN